jgi:gluconolactonase
MPQALEVRDRRLTALVAEDVAFERLGTGFLFTEGPLWQPREQHLTFSDMPGDSMRRWDAKDGVRTFRQPCAKSNGLVYDRQGRLVICEHATSRVTRLEPDGTLTTLASHWGPKELNSPNDIVCKSDGAIYFTDPTYGRAEYYGIPRDPQLGFRGVYRIDPRDGSLALLADDFGQPNGLCFSADERCLYVNDTERQHIRVFDVGADGGVKGGEVWAETKGEGPGAPDGMKLDAEGNIWCCGPGGIHVFAPDATCLGVLRVPEYTANFCWGEADMRALFITASTSLYRVRTRVAGRALV